MSETSSLRTLSCASKSAQQPFWHETSFSDIYDSCWNRNSESERESPGEETWLERRVEDSHWESAVRSCESCSSIWPKLSSSD